MDFHVRDERHVQDIEGIVLSVEHNQDPARGSQGCELRVRDRKSLIAWQVNCKGAEGNRPEEAAKFISTHNIEVISRTPSPGKLRFPFSALRSPLSASASAHLPQRQIYPVEHTGFAQNRD